MLHMQTLLAGLLLCLAPFVRVAGDSLLAHWAIGLALITLVIGIRLLSDGKVLFGLNFIYWFLNALYVGSYRLNRYQGSSWESRFFLSYSAFYFLIPCLLYLLVFENEKFRRHIPGAFALSSFLNSVYVCVGRVFGFGKIEGGHGFSGFIDYSAINGVLIVATFPFLWERCKTARTKLFAFSLMLASVILSKSSSPYLALAVLVPFLVFPYVKNRGRFLAFVVAAFALASTLLVASLLEGHEIINDNGRIKAWKVFMSVWAEYLPMIWGTGPGTFTSLAIETQQLQRFSFNGTRGDYWIFLHNEWLQMLYEGGEVGLGLALAWYLRTLYIFWKKEAYAALGSLFSFGVSSIVVFPTRYFYGSFLIGYLMYLGESYGQDTDTAESGEVCKASEHGAS